MKTPWRFVADLVWRKPKADVSGEHRPLTTKTVALESRPAIEEKVEQGGAASPELAVDVGQREETEAQISATDLTSEPVPQSEQAESTSVEPSVSVVVEDTDSAPEPVEHRNTAPADEKHKTSDVEALQKPTTPKKPRPAVFNETTESMADAASPVPAEKPKTNVEEIAALDAEVEVLRRQLSKKLIEQNTQLRKMLARFETR